MPHAKSAGHRSTREYIWSAIAALFVIGWSIFAFTASTRHEVGDRFMVLSAAGTIVFVFALLRNRAKADTDKSSTTEL